MLVSRVHGKHTLAVMGVAGFALLFAVASARHLLFRSGAYDLGWFDQAVFLISSGYEPIVSFSGSHVLADHAAFILYPLALFYWLRPSVYWLLAIQAAAFATSIVPLRRLCAMAGIEAGNSLLICATFLLQPIVFNANLFDFHPEVIAVPALLWAVLAARQRRPLLFLTSLVVTLGCKEVLALNVVALGLWLWVGEKNRRYGLSAIVLGTAWFVAAVYWLIPSLSGKPPASFDRYAHLGNSVPTIVATILNDPWRLAHQLASWGSVRYLLLLVLPVLWGLSVRGLGPLVGAAPTVLLNLMANYPKQRTLNYHYSVPVLPFLFLAIVAAWAKTPPRPSRRRWVLAWSLLAFIGLANHRYLWRSYPDSLPYLRAARKAVAAVNTAGPVLTTSEFAPHLTHRQHIEITDEASPPEALGRFDFVLLSTHRPGWRSSPSYVERLRGELAKVPQFRVILEEEGVVLFAKRGNAP
ncbi:MAG: hypothetical protein KatS3mg007_0035 [Thermoanaerobaculum sp.]|nr:MAG: hypothetical protein KatS3mg007_0035 [Thermoanaerobaculum sp.]